ncbi:MAG: DNA polymerase III subunit gamma/tau [Micavibrio sp.]|nr:MAG: DNA polymerase III subunit gamma/tau [Micavibrio sp.]
MSEKQEPYRVLARKYRPQSFEELIGQDALVRTLKNAIESGRIAHAFMLTGVRGVGKTTTARIIAKALNYTGADGTAGPTTGPTDDCQLCQAISEDRHPDVMEMDAATRTGVDDIREILDGVRYAPSEARYKVYIIDEVHMLSKQAFNALLKTLEEPPEHVKFIFATTEIRKVPVTVLSRCQRFDLRRVDEETLSAHYQKICGLENVSAEDEAIAMISRAADGSVRDGLSLLDQGISLGGEKITAEQVGAMLGLADRAKSLDLLEKALTGDMPEALAIMEDFYRNGGDPATIIQDLLDLTHILTRLRAVPEAGEMKQALSGDMIKRAKELAGKLSMPTLGKTWQILLKGLGEVNIAPSPQTAAEMVIIRLVYAADLPDPADLIKKLKDQPSGAQSNQPSAPPQGGERESVPVSVGNTAAASAPAPQQSPQTQIEPVTEKALASLEDIVSLLETENEFLLAGQVVQFVHLVKLEQGRLEINLEPEAPQKLAQDMGLKLSAMAGRRWMVSVSGTKGAPTLAQQEKAQQKKEYEDVLKLPVIQDILEVFPDAKITNVKNKG